MIPLPFNTRQVEFLLGLVIVLAVLVGYALGRISAWP